MINRYWLIVGCIVVTLCTLWVCYQGDDSQPLPDAQGALKKMIRGKDVVIVGPSTSLVGQRLGKSIDNSKNVIIRLNKFHRITGSNDDDVTSDYGTRTDVLFHNFLIVPQNLESVSLVKSGHPLKLKYINNTEQYKNSQAKHPNIPHEQMDPADISEQLDKLKSFPTVGFCTVCDLMNNLSCIKSLSLFGIEFGYNPYNPKYSTIMVNKNLSTPQFKKKNRSHHDFNSERELFKEMYQKLSNDDKAKIKFNDRVYETFLNSS